MNPSLFPAWNQKLPTPPPAGMLPPPVTKPRQPVPARTVGAPSRPAGEKRSPPEATPRAEGVPARSRQERAAVWSILIPILTSHLHLESEGLGSTSDEHARLGLGISQDQTS